MVVEGRQYVEVAGVEDREDGGGDEAVGEDFRDVDARWDVNGWVSGVRWSALKLGMQRGDILLKRSIRDKSHAMAILLWCVPRSLSHSRITLDDMNGKKLFANIHDCEML